MHLDKYHYYATTSSCLVQMAWDIQLSTQKFASSWNYSLSEDFCRPLAWIALNILYIHVKKLLAQSLYSPAQMEIYQSQTALSPMGGPDVIELSDLLCRFKSWRIFLVCLTSTGDTGISSPDFICTTPWKWNLLLLVDIWKRSLILYDMGQVTQVTNVRLSCYLVLLSFDSKTR